MTQYDTRVKIKRLRDSLRISSRGNKAPDATVTIIRLARESESSSTESRALDMKVTVVRPATGGNGGNRFSARLGAAKLGFMRLGQT